MLLTMLGTGHAGVTECYNTCFLLSEGENRFLVDGGGGNGLIRQLRHLGIRPDSIQDVFVTHRHTDHILGIFWLLRDFARRPRPGMPRRELNIYSHKEVITILQTTAGLLFPGPESDGLREQVRFHEVKDGETRSLLGREVTFFDTHAVKATQFGFCMKLDGHRTLTCCGDEPYNESERAYAEGCDWLLHEAFCLESQADRFHPHEIRHSTVQEACRTAESLGVKNLLLYHTEDLNLPERRRLYEEEGRPCYQGNLFIPEDLETLDLG